MRSGPNGGGGWFTGLNRRSRRASATGFGTRAEPGGDETLLATHRVRRCGRSAPVQLSKLRLQIGFETGPVLALERAQLVDLLLQGGLLLVDRAEDLGVLARCVALQRGSLLAGLPLQSLGPGTGVAQHGLGSRSGLVDHTVGLGSGIGEQLLRLGPGLAQHPIRYGLGLAGQPVSHLLSQAQHLGSLDVVVTTWCGLLDHRRRHRGHHRPWRLQRTKITSGIDRRSTELAIELLNLVAEIVVFLDQTSQLGLNQVEEGVHLVLVVAPLADRRLTERDVVNVGGGQRHRITSRTPRRLCTCWATPEPGGRYVLGSTTRISMNTTSSRTIMDRSKPTPPMRMGLTPRRSARTGGSVMV